MAGNPWLVDSLQTFWQLKCPECPFDSKEEDIFKYHAVTKHPLSLALFAKEFDYSVTVNNQSLGSIKSEISLEKHFDNSLDDGFEQKSEEKDLNFDNKIENAEIVADHKNGSSSETLSSTLHEELMIKEEFSELIEDLENENLQDTNKSGGRQLKRKSGLNHEREEPDVNHDIDELSDSEKSSEFMNRDKISFIENSEFYAEGNCQIPLVGTNFTATKSRKRIVFHHEGFNYNRTRISKKGTCVFLRLVISFL